MPSPSPAPGAVCGCEVPGEKFCNYDYGHTGFCEACVGSTDILQTNLGCEDRGLPAAGAADCRKWCHAASPSPQPWPTPTLCLAETYGLASLAPIASDDACQLWLDAGHNCDTTWDDVCATENPYGAEHNSSPVSNLDCAQCGGGGGESGSGEVGSGSGSTAAPAPATCTDTDNGAMNRMGMSCASMPPSFWAMCTWLDDDDFTASAMCCMCGGGSTAAPAAATSPSPPPPSPPPPSPPTSTPLPLVQSSTGTCVLQGDCVCSSNYPGGACAATSTADGQYGNDEACEITFSGPVTLEVHLFDTESCCDAATVDSVQYKGTAGPDGVTASSLSFSSDSSVGGSGFKICFAPAQGQG